MFLKGIILRNALKKSSLKTNEH